MKISDFVARLNTVMTQYGDVHVHIGAIKQDSENELVAGIGIVTDNDGIVEHIVLCDQDTVDNVNEG